MKIFFSLLFFLLPNSALAVSVMGHDLGSTANLIYLSLGSALIILLLIKSTRSTTISLILALSAVWAVYEVLDALSFINFKRETYLDKD